MSREDENIAYQKHVRDKVDALQKQIGILEDKRIALEREQGELQAGQSPIKPGDIIEWERRDGRALTGRVIRVWYKWDGFEYRCHILSVKDGREIGFATVETSGYPRLKDLTPAEKKKFKLTHRKKELNAKAGKRK